MKINKDQLDENTESNQNILQFKVPNTITPKSVGLFETKAYEKIRKTRIKRRVFKAI